MKILYQFNKQWQVGIYHVYYLKCKQHRIRIYLHDLSTIQSIPNTLANDFSRLHNILKDTFVHRGESTGAWTLGGWSFLWWTNSPSSCNQNNILYKSQHHSNIIRNMQQNAPVISRHLKQLLISFKPIVSTETRYWSLRYCYNQIKSNDIRDA